MLVTVKSRSRKAPQQKRVYIYESNMKYRFISLEVFLVSFYGRKFLYYRIVVTEKTDLSG